ncbi:hypothetical protein AG2_056 [Listeria phage vB_LmoM_AG20]|uniref:Uncharacterized protein n=1 Tax=Listeria phage vB_LmoM_AG20 TaxID=1168744 RepID=M4GZY5_9CAUD|nr:hypothetical protein AG2_056 [Listeria phage vB_LmoM_AG20]AFJ75992.1 hypothetical protein AG2_056 [Listeria phage vB_LmoM_AG20]WIW77292.1 hypothetical protein CKA15_076 [Listeria phage cka15]
MEVVLVSSDDWEELYIDGKLADIGGHRLKTESVVNCVLEAVSHNYKDVPMESYSYTEKYIDPDVLENVYFGNMRDNIEEMSAHLE